jgi:hypothetical protein
VLETFALDTGYASTVRDITDGASLAALADNAAAALGRD